ncbi:hypothetical protein D9M68_954030 [compost metagenome]
MHARAGLGCGRHVHALAIAVELHAVVRAADAVLLVAAEVQRHAAVRAELADQAGLAVGVAKGQQLLAQQLNAHLRPIDLGYFVRHQRGHPVAPQQVAHAGVRADPGERF